MELDDCADFIRWRNSDFIKSKFIYKKDITLEQQMNWVKTQVETGKVAQFIIWDKTDNKKIGCVYLQHLDLENMTCEFGILIGEQEYLGGGRGTEANLMICDYGFSELHMKKIYLRVLSDNIAAQKSYEKAGFYIDDIHDDECDADVIFMSKIKDERE